MSRKRFELIWSEPAKIDLKEIVQHIGRRNPQRARELARRWIIQMEALCDHAERGRFVPETMAIGVDIYRELILTPYRAIYRVRSGRVFIMGFFDGRRNLEDILFERLAR
jgi:plasmid stabilization system protein ParE